MLVHPQPQREVRPISGASRRTAFGIATVALVVGALALACGDPYYTVWVVNESPNSFVISTQVTYIQSPSATSEPETLDWEVLVPPAGEGAAITGGGVASLSIAIMNLACEVVARIEVPEANVHVVLIDAQGTPQLVRYEDVFSNSHPQPDHVFATTEACPVPSPTASP